MGLNRRIKSFALSLGFEIRRVPTLNDSIYDAICLLHSAHDGSDWSRRFLSCAVKYKSVSHSQVMQDIFAISMLAEKRNGYFVEFGAGDGVTLSNSYMLEKVFDWTGIVAEPSASFIPMVAANRGCAIDTRCVWSSSGQKLTFSEIANDGELSTITEFEKSDNHDRSNAIRYSVETVSLNDLLTQHGAPNEIDYLSIDTEGSELKILQALDFTRWRFGVITVEHNFVQERRQAICRLLKSNSYSPVATDLSRWDDWYIRSAP